jgi:hypothetical protein
MGRKSVTGLPKSFMYKQVVDFMNLHFGRNLKEKNEHWQNLTSEFWRQFLPKVVKQLDSVESIK